MGDTSSSEAVIEEFPLNPGSTSFGEEVDKVCHENELVISTWSPIHLRNQLSSLYWKDDRPAVLAMAFWEDTQKYIYLPRLLDKSVLSKAITSGTTSSDFFGTAYGENDGKYEGFALGESNVQLDDTLLLIEPSVASEYAAMLAAEVVTADGSGNGSSSDVDVESTAPGEDDGSIEPGVVKSKSFFGSVAIAPSAARVNMENVANEIVKLLLSDPLADVTVNIEIKADFPEGVEDNLKRSVSENADTLNFSTKAWE